MIPTAEPVDFVEELRLRRWARENYCYAEARQDSWHPIVHEEMQRREAEGLIIAADHVLALDDADLAPSDSTILTDEPATETEDVANADQHRRMPLLMGPIVPLAPSLPGLHGPHEITPPHTRVAEPVETTELHFG